MFVRCANDQCGWEQDDFWSETYNPIRSLEFYRDLLVRALEKPPAERRIRTELGQVPLAQVIPEEMRKRIKRIEGMKWWTLKDFQDDQDKRCPRCGGADFVMD